MRPCAPPLLRSAATGLFIVPRCPRYPPPPLFTMLPAPECFEPRASLYIYMKGATVGRRRETTAPYIYEGSGDRGQVGFCFAAFEFPPENRAVPVEKSRPHTFRSFVSTGPTHQSCVMVLSVGKHHTCAPRC